ncbi:MAG: AIR synthase related protein [Eubacterium sp.]
MRIEKIRDCTVIYLNQTEAIVITCDSIGAIGNKKMDIVQVTPEHAGHETAKVALGEMLALGATPIAVSDGLSVEMHPTGERIIKGIKDAIAELPDYEIALTGSCEDNMPTVQTGAGITVVGVVKNHEIKYKITQSGYIGLLVGKPLYGEDFSKELYLALRLPDFRNLRKIKETSEMVPVGSKGVAYEIEKIAEDNGLHFQWNEQISFDINQSGGPASCCVVTVQEKDFQNFCKQNEKMVTVLGEFQKR